MRTYYLKAIDENALWLALEAAGLAVKQYDPEDPANERPDDLDPETDWEPTGAFDWVFIGKGALDIIGTIYKPTGNMLTDDEGNEYPETVAIEGFHANLLAERGITGLPEVEFTTTNEDGETVTVNAPATPKRKFAGA